MSDNNLALWSAVERTPVEHTKPITGKSYSGNSPKPHWLVRKATETFGPCGIGWGFTIVDERIEPGPGEERMHVARVRLWYEWGGKRGEVEHIGGTPFAGVRASGKPFMDEDAPKKSITDALVKALSMIGFAGDIFLGRYDDNKYMAELREDEREARRPVPQPRLVASQPNPEMEDRLAYMALARTAINSAEFATELDQWWVAQSGKRREYGIVKGTPEYDELARMAGEAKANLPADITAAG